MRNFKGFQTSRRENKNTGFTIIELLIASAVFSVVLVGVMSAFIQISRIFYKGVNMSNTQNATRTVTQDIENDLQFSSIRPDQINDNYNSTAGNSPAHSNYFCVGDHRYAYFLGAEVGSATLAGVYQENISSGCPSINASTPGGVAVNPATADQLLSNGMQLNSMGIDCGNPSDRNDPPGIRCRINVHVVFFGGSGGSPDGLFASPNYSGTAPYNSQPWLAPDAECTGSLTSSQYCVTADYDRSVTIVGFAD